MPKDATSKFSKKDVTKLKSIKTLLIQILKADTAKTNRIQLMENSLRLRNSVYLITETP